MWVLSEFFVFLIVCVRLMSRSQDSKALLIRSWKDGMKEEWFLQVGERCEVVNDQRDHFEIFFNLVYGSGFRQGVTIATAQDLAARRCLKEKLSRDRQFGCLSGICDCLDPNKVWESKIVDGLEKGSCKKYDGVKCRNKEECLSGYICEQVEFREKMEDRKLQTRINVVARERVRMLRAGMDRDEKDLLDLQSEERRRKYIRAVLAEGNALQKLSQSSFPVGLSGVNTTAGKRDETEVKRLLGRAAQHPLLQSQSASIANAYHYVALYVHPMNQNVAKPKPTEAQMTRGNEWIDRIEPMILNSGYVYKITKGAIGFEEVQHENKNDEEFATDLAKGRLAFFNAKEVFNIAAGKVCQCDGNVTTSADCVIGKDRRPIPPKLFLVNSTDNGKIISVAHLFKPSSSLQLQLFTGLLLLNV